MSRVATAAAGLVTLWSPLKLTDVQLDVRRGAPIGGDYGLRMVLVEHDANPEARADSTFETSWSDLAATSVEERGEITCAVVAQVGDDDLAAVEAAADVLFGRCVALLAADRTIGGAVLAAYVTRGSAAQIQNERGIAVLLPFTVAYFVTYAAASA